MAENKFIVWRDGTNPAGGIIPFETLESDSEKKNGFESGNPASSSRVNSALRQSTLVTAALMKLANETYSGTALSYEDTINDVETCIKDIGSELIVRFTPASDHQTNLNPLGEDLKTSFGKIYKYFADLGALAFTNAVDSQGDSTTTAPSVGLLKRSSFARVYRSITEIDSSFTPSTALLSIFNAMSIDSIAILSANANVNLIPSGVSTNNGTVILCKKVSSRFYIEFSSDSDGYYRLDSTSGGVLGNWHKVAYDIDLSSKLNSNGDGKNVTVTFSEASSRVNINNGETLATMFGKIKKWFTDIYNKIFNNVDTSPTQDSNNFVTSGGVYTALSGKQNTLTFDNTPTYNSSNPVKSGGVYDLTSKLPICSTSGSTAAKILSLPNFNLVDGLSFQVYFINDNTVANPTLDINGTGAKSIYVNGSWATSSNFKAGWHTVTYDYNNGTSRYLIDSVLTNYSDQVIYGTKAFESLGYVSSYMGGTNAPSYMIPGGSNNHARSNGYLTINKGLRLTNTPVNINETVTVDTYDFKRFSVFRVVIGGANSTFNTEVIITRRASVVSTFKDGAESNTLRGIGGYDSNGKLIIYAVTFSVSEDTINTTLTLLTCSETILDPTGTFASGAQSRPITYNNSYQVKEIVGVC